VKARKALAARRNNGGGTKAVLWYTGGDEAIAMCEVIIKCGINVVNSTDLERVMSKRYLLECYKGFLGGFDP
jgi:hypothetical protein